MNTNNTIKIGTLEFSLGKFDNIEVNSIGWNDVNPEFYQNNASEDKKEIEKEAVHNINIAAAETLSKEIRFALENIKHLNDLFDKFKEKNLANVLLKTEQAMTSDKIVFLTDLERLQARKQGINLGWLKALEYGLTFIKKD